MDSFVCGGLTTYDLVYLADELPVRGQKGTARVSYVDVGGPVANAAVTAALLGSPAVVHSVIGESRFAEEVEEMLSGYGVRLVDHDPAIDLPVASVWVDRAGERTILSTDNKRSEARVRRDTINMEQIAAVLLDGHYPNLQLALAEAAVAGGVPVVLDCGRWRPVFAELLPVATDVIMTATFRPPGLEGAGEGEAVATIAERYQPELCAMSRGPSPILVASSAGVDECPVPQVEVVDTTGAGDVLHGAYLHFRYTLGLATTESLRRAAAVAAASCRALGSRRLTDTEL